MDTWDVVELGTGSVALSATNEIVVREAAEADHPHIVAVLRAAYGEYARRLPAALYGLYLADLLDVDRHARLGRLLVAEVDGRIEGTGAFYPDASVQGLGLPAGWAGGRGLAVSPRTRGLGVARTLLAASERLARDSGAPVFAFHTAVFMTAAVRLYEGLGFRRSPEHDVDLGVHFGLPGIRQVPIIAFRRDLTRPAHPTSPNDNQRLAMTCPSS